MNSQGNSPGAGRLTREELEAFLHRVFSQQGKRPSIVLEEVTDDRVRFRMPFGDQPLRPSEKIGTAPF